MTRTSASGPRTSRRRSCSCGCSSARATPGRGTSTPTPTATRTRRACGTSPPAACDTYLALAERARHFDSLPEVAEALEAASAPELGVASVDGDGSDALKAESERLDALAERGYYNERLDQILVEVLLGLR
jgi:hypothetical protein